MTLPEEIKSKIIENSKAYHEQELEMSLPANSLVAYQYGAEFGYQLGVKQARKELEQKQDSIIQDLKNDIERINYELETSCKPLSDILNKYRGAK